MHTRRKQIRCFFFISYGVFGGQYCVLGVFPAVPSLSCYSLVNSGLPLPPLGKRTVLLLRHTSTSPPTPPPYPPPLRWSPPTSQTTGNCYLVNGQVLLQKEDWWYNIKEMATKRNIWKNVFRGLIIKLIINRLCGAVTGSGSSNS